MLDRCRQSCSLSPIREVISVKKEGEPGAGADVEQPKFTEFVRDQGERWQQQPGPANLVCLHRPAR